MTQERVLRAQGQKTMQRLLVAGRKVFETHGFHGARVDDIVKAAHTSHGTFYLYFSNKEDLFRALAADAMTEMETLGERLGPITPDDDGRSRLRVWVGDYVDTYAIHGKVIVAWGDREFADRDLGKRANESLFTLSGAIGARIAQARGLKGDARADGVACLSMLERFNYFQQSRQITFDHKVAIDTLTRAMFEGFFRPDPPSAQPNRRGT